METFGLILIILVLVILYAIIHILVYNKIQFYLTKIENVESMVDEALREKYDIIIKLETTIKDTINDKNEYLKDLKDLKNEKVSNFEMQRKLSEAQAIIENLYYDNEELEKKNKFHKIFAELKKANEKLTAGITYYNNNTSILNNYIRKFPNNLIARIHGIKVKTFFDGKDLTDNDIFDFKL